MGTMGRRGRIRRAGTANLVQRCSLLGIALIVVGWVVAKFDLY